jgi:orf14 protein
MAKTTKKVQGIHSLIKFQRHQGVESLTIEGKQELADLKQDNKGDTSLILNADKDKVNELVSAVPYLDIAHTTTGEAPNQTKTATLNQDLSHFPLSGGELVTVDKTSEGLTLNDTKVKELIETKATELKKEIGSGAGSGTGATATPITLNGGELVTVDKSGDTLTLNDSKVKELVENTKTEILKTIPPKTPTALQYDLEAEEVLNAEYSISGSKLRYSTLILSTEHDGQYESCFIHIPLNNNQTTKKLSDNVIVRITPYSEGFQIELFFKNATNVIISGVDYCGTTLTPTLLLNTLSETYNDVNASVLPTSRNVPQPIDDGYDHL